MTVKLLELRARPLLTPPPGTEAWRTVSDHDAEIMRGQADEYGRRDMPELLLHMYFWMQGLGVMAGPPQPWSKSNDWRNNWEHLRTAGMGVWLAENGLARGWSEERTKQSRMMEEYRARGDGWALLKTHRVLADMGKPRKILPSDLKLFRAELERVRAEDIRRGRDIAYVHHTMKALGVGEPLTPGDAEAVMEAVSKARREGDGLTLAETLYLAKDLAPAGGEAEPARMPPLRRFRG